MKKIPLIIALLALLLPASLFAQQQPMYGQYIFNNSVINPAQAGVSENSQWGILSRYQWVGIPGAPRTSTAYGNIRLPRQLGLAVGLYQDRLGPETNLQFQADLAYHARLSENWYLSAGVRTVLSSIRINLRDIQYIDPNDPHFQDVYSSGLLLNAGAGLLAYNEKHFIGLSIPLALRNRIATHDVLVSEVSRHLFAYGGSNIALAPELTFIPSVLFKYAEDAPVQLDLNAVFGFRDVFDFGPMIRSNLASQNQWFDAVGFLVGIRFSQNWYLGYMYEYPTTALNLATKQTHEFSLRYLWGSRQLRTIRSPRYFL